jgi:DHA1 family bicyclomycin/chloramphenicol resistance-like MFS transporter
MWRTIFLLASIVALTPLAIDMYLPAMPAIAESYGTELKVIQGSMSTFLIGFAIGQLIHGPLSDALGRRPIALAGLSIFATASLALAFAESASGFLLLRIVQAVGGAAGSVVINAVITDKFRGHEAVQVRSTIVMVMTLAPMLAPTIGGALLLWANWRAIFMLLAVWALMTLVWSYLSLQESNQHRHALNFKNVITNYRQVISRPLLWPWLAGISLNTGAFFSFLAASPYVYIQVFEIPPEIFGFYFSANVIVMTLGSAFNSRFTRYFGTETVLRTAQRIQIIALAALLLLLAFDLLTLWSLVPLCAIFIGLNSFVFPNAASLLMERFNKNAGTAAALLGASQFAMGALFSLLVAQGDGAGSGPMLLIMSFGGFSAYYLIGIGCKRLNE